MKNNIFNTCVIVVSLHTMYHVFIKNKDGISHTDEGEEDEKELFEDRSYAYRSYALGGFLHTGSCTKE